MWEFMGGGVGGYPVESWGQKKLVLFHLVSIGTGLALSKVLLKCLLNV